MGITKCQYHARQCVYWPGINEDIRKMVKACPAYQHHHPQEPRQPLQPTPAPEHPWQHIGADFFTFDRFKYLVIIDYYTKMPFIRKISPSQCNAAKTSQCSRSCSLSMGCLKQSDLTMAHNLPAINSLSLLRNGTLITTPVPLGTQGVMDKLKQLSKLQRVFSPMPNTQGRTPTLPCWHTGVHPSMPTFIHQLKCSTRVIRTTVPQRIRHNDPQAAADRSPQ